MYPLNRTTLSVSFVRLPDLSLRSPKSRFRSHEEDRYRHDKDGSLNPGERILPTKDPEGQSLRSWWSGIRTEVVPLLWGFLGFGEGETLDRCLSLLV